MRIKRESVKPKRESMARTPGIMPVDAQEASHGVYWERNIPDDCRRGVVNSNHARKAFVFQMTTQLARQNKAVVSARWM